MKRIFENDKTKIIEYLLLEPYYNVYILGDIELFGLSSDTVKIFVDGEDEISCVLMEYAGDYVIYSQKNNFDVAAVVQQIKSSAEYADTCVSGKESTVKKLAAFFPEKALRKTLLARFESEKKTQSSVEVKKLDESNADDLLRLYLGIQEFNVKYSHDGRQRVVRELKNGRTFAIYGNAGELIAAASSTAESRMGAMITNVCTHPLHRRKGLAEKILQTLIASLQQSGVESVCLYYDNPDAARLYKKLGFVDKGGYMTLR